MNSSCLICATVTILLVGCSGNPNSSSTALATPLDAASAEDSAQDSSVDVPSDASSTQDSGHDSSSMDAVSEESADSGDNFLDANSEVPDATEESPEEADASNPINPCTWETVNLKLTMPIMRGMSGSSPSDVLVIGSSALSRWSIIRYDGHEWWNDAQGGQYDIYGVVAFPGGEAIAVGATEQSDPLILRREEVAGLWKQEHLQLKAFPRAAWGSGPDSVFVAGWWSSVLRYEDGSWTMMPIPKDVYFEGIWGTDDSNVYAVGWSSDGGEIFKYNGSSWQEVWQGISHLWGVWGSSKIDVYAVGGRTVVRFDGMGWHELNTGTVGAGAVLSSVWGTSSQDVFVGGIVANEARAVVLHYDGVHWQDTGDMHANDEIQALWATPDGQLFAIGTSPSIDNPVSSLFRYVCQ